MIHKGKKKFNSFKKMASIKIKIIFFALYISYIIFLFIKKKYHINRKHVKWFILTLDWTKRKKYNNSIDNNITDTTNFITIKIIGCD